MEFNSTPDPIPQSEQTTSGLATLTGMHVYPQSVISARDAIFALGREGLDKRLIVLSARPLPGIQGVARTLKDGRALTVAPTDATHAASLRALLPHLRPRRLGLQTSAGMGDRLGVATPGHARAARGTGVAPIFAQQSMRENARTGRTPQQVIDDAMWGVFQEGWLEGYGADADHLKRPEDIDLCVAAGYTFFTIDPGDYVNNAAHAAPMQDLVAGLDESVPWADLDLTKEQLYDRYLNKTFDVEGYKIAFPPEVLVRAVMKYGRAIAHTARMYRRLASLTDDFELEVSVDETETVTSPEEHFFFARELKRLGVQWVSLAPRYVGEFEKGVDYIGDLAAFEDSLARHAAIARHLGPYKLSIHSGSDKFSIYPAFARQTRGVVHLKTAGTSYLEALRVIARVNPALFREILALAIERYPIDRATYHVSGELRNLPDPAATPDQALGAYLDQFDAREVLHVTYGSALDAYGDDIIQTLREHEEAYYDALEIHFRKHLQPFAR
ncbi:MAG TPA: hypothetical protein G4O05_01010 [Caldilineae bacterium]|nr:hypothetical protein [Caldilineae bacterium]